MLWHAVSHLKQERTHGVPGKDGGAEAVGMGFVAGRTKKCQRERERGGGRLPACLQCWVTLPSQPVRNGDPNTSMWEMLATEGSSWDNSFQTVRVLPCL